MPRTKPTTAAAPTQSQIVIPPMFAWQQCVHDCPARYRVISAARQIGKTFWGVLEGIDAAMRGGEVWWIAPDFSLTEPGYDTLRTIVEQEPFNHFVEEYKQRRLFTFRNGATVGTIQIKSADDPQKLRGKTLTLAILDEFAFMHPDAWFDGVSHALTVKKGRAIFISSPYGKNHFWEMYRLGDPTLSEHDPNWYSFRFDQHANPLISQADIEEKERTMPKRKFEREVLALFTDEGGEVFTNFRKRATADPQLAPMPGHEYVAGLDYGSWQDFTSITVADKTTRREVYRERFTGLMLEKQLARIDQLHAHWKPTIWQVEENAAGDVVCQALEARGLPVARFNTNIATKRPLIEAYAAAIEMNEYTPLRDQDSIRQHEAYESDVTPNGTVRYGAPKGMHDDDVISGALCYRAAVGEAEHLPKPFVFAPFQGLYGKEKPRTRRVYR
jgi:hypothetical protein